MPTSKDHGPVVKSDRIGRFIRWVAGAIIKGVLNSQDIEVRSAPAKVVVIPTPEGAQAALEQTLREGAPKPQPWWVLVFVAVWFLGFAALAAGAGYPGLVVALLAITAIAVQAALALRVQQKEAARRVAQGLPRPAQQMSELGGPAVAAVAVMMLGVAWTFVQRGSLLPALIMGVLGLLIAVLGVGATLRDRALRKVARVMATGLQTGSDRETRASPPADLAPLKFRFLASRAAPVIPPPLAPSPERNSAGRPPQTILYLYNFRAGATAMEKMIGGLQRHGPVFCLASPMDFAQGRHLFDTRVGKAQSELLTDAAAFDARFESLDLSLLPPGDKRLMSSANATGAWPWALMLCSDVSWTHGVKRLLDVADIVVIDATDYADQRVGLNWEIDHVLWRMDLRRVVVRTTDGSDMWALKRAFEAAWAKLPSDSPNAQPDAAPLTLMVFPSDDEQRNAEQAAFDCGEVPDPTGVLAKMNGVLRGMVAGQWRQACEDDRMLAVVYEGLR